MYSICNYLKRTEEKCGIGLQKKNLYKNKYFNVLLLTIATRKFVSKKFATPQKTSTKPPHWFFAYEPRKRTSLEQHFRLFVSEYVFPETIWIPTKQKWAIFFFFFCGHFPKSQIIVTFFFYHYCVSQTIHDCESTIGHTRRLSRTSRGWQK